MEHLVHLEGMPPTNGYSHVTIFGGVAYVSGQVPVRADGSVVVDSVEAQVEQVFANVSAALRALDVTWGHVAKLTYFVTDMAALPVVRAVRDRYIDAARPPASSLVQVVALVDPRFVIEVEAIVALEV